MTDKISIFKKTYKDYLAQIGGLDLKSMERKLGVKVKGDEVIVPLFGEPQRISKGGITGPSEEKLSFEACVILSKYLLLCPDEIREDDRWVAYRDLKDSGPLTSYFENDVEKAISRRYTGKVDSLKHASESLGGDSPDMGLSYDLSMRFRVLPKIPVLMLFNDEDNEFPAKCSLLFEKRAEHYLDAECLAMAGRLVYVSLKEKEK